MGCIGLRVLVVVTTAFCALINGPVMSAEWNLNKKLTFGLLHTDSLVYAEPDEQQRTVTGQVVPTLSLLRRGAYSNLLLLSEIEYLKSDEEGVESLRPRLFSSLETTIKENRLFLDADVELRQEYANFGSAILEPLSQGTELRTRYNLNIDPRIALDLGQFTDLQLVYEFNAFGTTDSEIGDSLTNGATLSFDHDRADRGYNAGTSFTLNRSDISGSEPLIQKNVVSSVGLDVGQAWKVSGSVGREWNQIPILADSASSAPEVDTESGAIWDVGIQWNPVARTAFFAGYGKRFYGVRPLLEITHRMRRSNISLNWTRNLTRTRATLTSFDLLNNSDLQEETFLGSLPQDSVALPEPEIIVNEFAVEEQFRAKYYLRGRISSLRLEALYARRELKFQKNSATESRVSLRTSFSRQLGKRTSVSLSYQRTEGKSESRYYENRVRVTFSVEI